MTLFLKTLQVNGKYKILFIIQIIIFVLFIKGEVFDLWEQKNINESILYDSDMYYISNCVNESQDVNTLTKKCRDIQGRYGIEVGYELQGNAKLSGEYVTVIYVNDTMEKIRYKLKYGMWFEGKKKQQFILGYDWNRKYKIGDIIKITLSTGTQVKGKVSGILKKDFVFAKLNSGGKQMDYQLMLEKMDNNCLITNSKEMVLVMIFMIWPRASVAANRITEVLDTDITIKDGSLDGDTKEKGTVEFKNVSFAYTDAAANVVENISFKANKGETIAFIGATGCGKSTVINLIPRFYDVTDGEVLVDGINVKDYKQNELRNKIGYVSQKAILFSGDVESNVAYGDNGKKDATPDEVKEAVKIACADDFVENLKDKYHGYVAQGGDNFSGGQKQRLSIARAIAKKAEILIFDDSFSALDYKTDRKLRTALKKQCSDTTKIIVAQRIGTIRDADLIIVLDGGKIAGKGTHSELMESCEEYRQIAYSQLSKEELA